MAIVTDTLEGVIDNALWYHYDLTADVLYLRLVEHRETHTVSEETPDGFLLLRRDDNDEPVGLTIVNWWRRYGSGPRPDSISRLEGWIEPWGKKLAA